MRHRVRHAQHSVAEFVRAELDGLGWLGPDPPFGATPATLLEFQPEEAGVRVEPNTVAVTLDTAGAQLNEELGGPLTRTELPTFIDIYGQDTSTAVAIASDIFDALTDQVLTLYDWTAAEPIDSGERLEVELVTIERPQAGIGANAAEFKRHWRIVKAQIYATHPAVR